MDINNLSYIKILEDLNDGLYFTDKNRKIIYWNKAAERITGFSQEEVVGSSCSDNILTHIDSHGCSLCKNNCPLAGTIKDKKPREAEVYLHHKNGQRIPVFVRVSPLKDNDDNVIGGIELFTDISNFKANELRIKELEEIAMLDKLTHLANRNYIEKELQSRLEENRHFHIPFGVMIIDVDDFKSVNDKYGHIAGDHVLKFIADTLSGNARPFDLYGRWGGEEFIGIIKNIDLKGLTDIAERQRILIKNAYVFFDKNKIQVTISIGASIIDKDESLENLLRKADLLLYKSKNLGKDRLSVA